MLSSHPETSRLHCIVLGLMGKPKFPTSQIKTVLPWSRNSSFTVNRLHLVVSFVQLRASKWNTNAEYFAIAKNVGSVNVVNDDAEGGVKLSSDFVEIDRYDENPQNVLQAVEKDRKAAPDLHRKCGNKDTGNR